MKYQIIKLRKNTSKKRDAEQDEKKEEKMETELTFENYDFPKEEAYKKNNEYYSFLKGENVYERFFFIQYLFEPNLQFSNVKLSTNYEEFRDFTDRVMEEFNNLKTGVDPLILIKKLKWLS